jgi:hypothetical protein
MTEISTIASSHNNCSEVHARAKSKSFDTGCVTTNVYHKSGRAKEDFH